MPIPHKLFSSRTEVAKEHTEFFFIQASHPMARKSKRDDLAASKAPTSKPLASDTGRQPRIVGWLVLIVGGLSSWYWYKPLPDTVNQTVHSTLPSAWPTSDSGPRSLWSEHNIILPSTLGESDRLPEPTHNNGNQQTDESRLIGAPKVSLIPSTEVQHDIRDVLKCERIPMVPVAPDLQNGGPISSSPSSSPKTWIPEHQGTNRISNSMPSGSNWPDQGYTPPARIQKEQRRSSVQITTQIPTLLETGMKTIRTIESDQSSANTSPANAPTSESASSPLPAPARQLQFIRQPARSSH